MRHVLNLFHSNLGLHVGVVDRRHDGRRPDAARAADDPADPLDAVAAEARAADEGDPEEVQARPAEAERRADEVLPGEQDQPGCLVPADAAAAAGLHRPLLHAPPLQVRKGGRSLVPPLHPVDRGAYDDALGRLRAPLRLRHEPDGVVVLHDDDRRQDAAHALHAHAARLRLHHRALPRGPCPLLGDDEPLDGRAGADHPAPRRARRRRPSSRGAARGRRRRTMARAATAPNGSSPEPKPAPSSSQRPRQVRRKKKRTSRR